MFAVVHVPSVFARACEEISDYLAFGCGRRPEAGVAPSVAIGIDHMEAEGFSSNLNEWQGDHEQRGWNALESVSSIEQEVQHLYRLLPESVMMPPWQDSRTGRMLLPPNDPIPAVSNLSTN